MPLRIKNWDEVYENSRSRDMKKLSWIPIPNKQDGLGYRRLLRHDGGEAAYGCFVAVVLAASKCRIRDGLLTDDGSENGRPWTDEDISLKTGFSIDTVRNMLKYCILPEIGWIDETPTAAGCGITAAGCGITAAGCGITAAGCGITAAKPQEGVIEGKGREEKGREENTSPPPPNGGMEEEKGLLADAYRWWVENAPRCKFSDFGQFAGAVRKANMEKSPNLLDALKELAPETVIRADTSTGKINCPAVWLSVVLGKHGEEKGWGGSASDFKYDAELALLEKKWAETEKRLKDSPEELAYERISFLDAKNEIKSRSKKSGASGGANSDGE